jgi:hypothetical protein
MKNLNITPDLLEWLEKKYPNEFPSPDMLGQDLWFKAGQLDVIKTLKNMAKAQSTQPEEKNPLSIRASIKG